MSHGRSLPDTVTKSLGPVSSCRRTDRTLVQKIRFGHLDNKSERCFRVSTNRPALYTQDLTGYPDKESGPYLRVTSRLDPPTDGPRRTLRQRVRDLYLCTEESTGPTYRRFVPGVPKRVQVLHPSIEEPTGPHRTFPKSPTVTPPCR